MSLWIHLGGVKAFADGSLGSNSALFYEVRTSILGNPYSPLIIWEFIFNIHQSTSFSFAPISLFLLLFWREVWGEGKYYIVEPQSEKPKLISHSW